MPCWQDLARQQVLQEQLKPLKKSSPRRQEGRQGHKKEGKDGFEAEKPSGQGGLGGFAVGSQ